MTEVPWHPHQISESKGVGKRWDDLKFPIIDMSDVGLSGFVDFKFFRDSANDSGEFAGADPNASAVVVKEFDCHYQRDSRGSRGEFTK